MRNRALPLIVLALALFAGAAHAGDFGKYTAPDGSIYFGSKPPVGAVLMSTSYKAPEQPTTGERVTRGLSGTAHGIANGLRVLGETMDGHPANCPSCGRDSVRW
jgi:hypothetical protein